MKQTEVTYHFFTDISNAKKVHSKVAERAQRAALQKTHANRKNTSTLRKQLNQFDNTRAANAHNTTKQRNALPIKCFIWLCCEHLQSVYLLVCVVSILLPPAVKLMKMFS